jgi:tetratricopeptide (TPR) repeat protein
VRWFGPGCVRPPRRVRAPHFALGSAFKQKGLLDEAIASFKEANQLNPRNIPVYENLARTLSVKGELDEAIVWYKEAIRTRPHEHRLSVDLIALYQQTGAWEEAITYFQESIRSQPDNAAALMCLGDALRAKGSLVESIVYYKEVIRLRPDIANAHSGLGEALREKGALDEAIPCLKEAVRLIDLGDGNQSFRSLSAAFLQKGAADEAIAYFQEVIRLKRPQYHMAYASLAAEFRQKGALDEAIACYQKYIQTTPDDYAPYMELAWLLATWEDPALRRPAEAVALAKKATKLHPNSDFASMTLGAAYYRCGDWQASRDVLNPSLHLGATNEDDRKFFLLAMVDWQLDQRDAAHAWYDRAVKCMKNQPVGQDVLGLRAEAAALLGIEDPAADKHATHGATSELGDSTPGTAREPLSAK